jgi:two-component system cell cycle response regulator
MEAGSMGRARYELDDQDCTAVATRAELTAALSKQKTKHRPWVVIVSGSATVGKMYALEGELVIGRAPDAQVRIDEDGVSRHHAKFIQTTEGNVEIMDLGSRNGTFVNGDRVSRLALRDGDKIQIGPISILKFSYHDELDEALQRNLYASATRDALTGVANKRTFAETLAKEFAFAKRHSSRLSLVTFDVDHFKKINDGFGHPCGDYVLKALADKVRGSLRTEDELARVGGEEFAVLLRDIDGRGAFECAERVRNAIAATLFMWEGRAVPVTISLGVATFDPKAHATPEALVQDADRQLYRAKGSGRNRVCGEVTTTLAGAVAVAL